MTSLEAKSNWAFLSHQCNFLNPQIPEYLWCWATETSIKNPRCNNFCPIIDKIWLSSWQSTIKEKACKLLWRKTDFITFFWRKTDFITLFRELLILLFKHPCCAFVHLNWMLRNCLNGKKWSESGQNNFKKSCRCSVWILFMIVEIDSAPSKTSRTLKILKFNNYNLDLQKSLPDIF